MYRQILKEGMEGDGVVMVGLIQACANLGNLKLGLSVHGFFFFFLIGNVSIIIDEIIKKKHTLCS